MKKETKKFMTLFKSLIGNDREGIFQPNSSSLIYYDAFGESFDNDDNVYLMVMSWSMINPKLLTKLI